VGVLKPQPAEGKGFMYPLVSFQLIYISHAPLYLTKEVER
jgi:hypothetical protein